MILAVGLLALGVYGMRGGRFAFHDGLRSKTIHERIAELLKPNSESPDPFVQQLSGQVADLWEGLQMLERRVENLERGDEDGKWQPGKKK